MNSPQGLVDHLVRELRAPLDGILALSQFLQTERLSPGAASHVQAIGDAGRTLVWLLEAAAELQSTDDRLFPAPAGLRALMDELEERWRGRAEEAGLTLMVAFDGDPESRALVDARRVGQAFDGLLDHAMRQVGRGVVEASLKVRADESGQHLMLEGRVRHSGSGSRPEDAREALNALAQGDMLRGGLGLALAHRAVSLLHGEMKADANAGAGATLRFDLSCAVAAAAAAPAAAAREPQAHILIVDDNATNRMVAEALCEMFECSSEVAVDGVEAVEMAQNGRFDLILMDIKMPRMDGVEAARAIRKLPGPTGRTPIVALTANASPEDVEVYLKVGMQGVVEKPIKPDLLLRALNDALSADVAHPARPHAA